MNKNKKIVMAIMYSTLFKHPEEAIDAANNTVLQAIARFAGCDPVDIKPAVEWFESAKVQIDDLRIPDLHWSDAELRAYMNRLASVEC